MTLSFWTFCFPFSEYGMEMSCIDLKIQDEYFHLRYSFNFLIDVSTIKDSEAEYLV